MKIKLLLLSLLAGGCATTDYHSSNDLLDLYTEEYIDYLNSGKYSDLKQSQRTFNKYKTARAYEIHRINQRSNR